MSPDTFTRPPRTASANRIRILVVVLAYTLFAASWVLMSDKLVQILFSDPDQIVLASMFKGWAFVGVTSLLLYGLMRHWACPDAGPAISAPVDSLRLGRPFLWLAAIIIAMTGLGIIHTFDAHKKEQVGRLQTIADLKTRQIADWLRERQGDADFIQGNDYFAELYRRWQASGDLHSGEQLHMQLERLHQSQRFDGVMLLDPEGKPLWTSGKAAHAIAPPLHAAVQLAKSAHKVQRVGPYHGMAGHAHMDFVVPLAAVSGGPVPVVILHIEPANWLFPMLQSQTEPGTRIETLLFRRDDEQVLFLSKLRHQEDTAAMPRLPLATDKLLAARVMRGEVAPGRLVEGEDYRGTAVIGVIRAIADTDWFLTVKLERSALYAETVGAAAWVGFVGLLALFMTGAGFYLLRQRQQLDLAQAIQQSQAERLHALQLLAAIADSSDEAIFAKDLDGRYILFNSAASRFVGKPAEAVLGCDDRVIFPTDQAEMLMTIGRQVIAENRIHSQEEKLDTVDGVRVFHTTKGPLRSAEGKVIGIFGISRDITERKATEDLLRTTERRFHDIVNASADWIWEVDAEGRYTYASENVFDLLGYKPEEIIGKTPFDLMPSDEAERVRSLFADMSVRREPFRDLGNINRHKDGSLRHLQINGMPILDADGKLLGYRGLDQDVTQRKQEELIVRQSEEFKRAILDSVSAQIAVLDGQGNIIAVNQSWMRFAEENGLHRSEPARRTEVGVNYLEVCLQSTGPYSEGALNARDGIMAVLKGSLPVFNLEYACHSPTQQRWFTMTVTPLAVKEQGVVITHTDITARKVAESALQQQTEELSLRNAELERFNRAMVGRELDMIALKQQINALSRQLGLEPPYSLAFLDEPPSAQLEGKGS